MRTGCRGEYLYLYSSPRMVTMVKLRMIRWAGNVARMDKKRNEYRFLVGKPETKRPLERSRYR
jgi:hypothetical protein